MQVNLGISSTKGPDAECPKSLSEECVGRRRFIIASEPDCCWEESDFLCQEILDNTFYFLALINVSLSLHYCFLTELEGKFIFLNTVKITDILFSNFVSVV